MNVIRRYINRILPIIVSLSFTNSYSQKEEILVDVKSKHLKYEGRVNFNNAGVAEIYWPGSSCKIKFRGTELKAILKDERGHNYYNVIIDTDSVRVLRLDSIKKLYTLASHLAEGDHTVELFRRTDWFNGITWFYGFQVSPQTRILDLPAKTKMIEFYGNSITVGAAVEKYAYSAGDTTENNNYLSYAYLTARHFNAKYTCIASSGIGMMVSWGSLIMPDLYNRLNPADSTSKWDFSKAKPGIVVVNLFQNDHSLAGLPDHPQFKRRFGVDPPTEEVIVNSYSKFIQNLRRHYPGSSIICVLGNMDAVEPGSPWPGYIEKAVASLHDKKVYTHFFPYKNTPDHPDKAEQQQMADNLVRFIDENIRW